MTDCLLHPHLASQLATDSGQKMMQSLSDQAHLRGDALWLSLAVISDMVSALTAGDGNDDDARMSEGEARSRIRMLGESCNWLAALAADASLIDNDDRIESLLARQVKRLGSQAFVLTADTEVAVPSASCEYEAVTLSDYLAREMPVPQIPFIDLARQQRRIRSSVEEGLFGVLAHGRYIGGPEIDTLEAQLAEYVGVRHAIAVSNGTDALLIAMLALDIGAGDEVITSPFTFAATGEMIRLLGARAVYVDIDRQTYNLDASQLAAAITERTRAIMPVSLYGQCADMDAINDIAHRHNTAVIEDGAQSFGATYKGRRSCGVSDIGCTSFFPSKPLGGYGDSGACFTDDDAHADAMRQIRDHGQTGRYRHTRLGINGRMSSFQASVLLAKLEIFAEEIELRVKAGKRYDRLFTERLTTTAPRSIVIPTVPSFNTSAYAQYTVLVEDRDVVQKHLADVGVPSAVHYPLPLNRQPALEEIACRVPVCDEICRRVLSLPMHPYISLQQQEYIVDALINAVSAANAA
ncbi:MAG: hypothetical protein DHS20C01_13750 [marine bacterium B5-7]|nr:MAG: hypothetical protein DHS20C01_13750 [marine bacterium B5-7]